MKRRSPAFGDPPSLLVSTDAGEIIDVPELGMAGMSLGRPVLPAADDLTSLPAGSLLMALPGRIPMGFDGRTNRFAELPEYHGTRVRAVAAFVAPGHAQVLTAACRPGHDAPRLPLYSYTAAGWQRGRVVCAAVRVDRDRRHHLCDADAREIRGASARMLRRYPRNRLVRHLIRNCVCRYQCPTATSFVLGRCECAVPVSTACNAACIGCISRQDAASGVVACHHRLGFAPTAGEIAAYAAPHLLRAPRAIVSFGQGCEGEPLLAADLVEEAILRIRRRTRRGVINMNSNGSRPGEVERLCRAGLDSIRISLNSAQPALYERYFRPRGYGFADVMESICTARSEGVWVSINYFLFPGFTDHPREMTALDALIERTGINMIQLRTLNIDPAWYIDALGLDRLRGRAIGVRQWITRMHRRWPSVRIGCFNPAEVRARRRRRTEDRR